MKAGERIPYGGMCMEFDGKLFLAPSVKTFYALSGLQDVLGPEEMVGVAHRPLHAGDSHAYEPGEEVELTVDGALLCDLGSGETAYCQVIDGRIKGMAR